MVQEKSKSIFHQIIFRRFRRMDKTCVCFGSLIKMIIHIIYFSQLLVGKHTGWNHRLQLLQFFNSLLRIGALINISQFQIRLFVLRIEINGLFIHLAGSSGILLSQSNVSFQYRNGSRFIIRLFSQSQVFLSFR